MISSRPGGERIRYVKTAQAAEEMALPPESGGIQLLLADLEPGGYKAHRARSSIVAALKLGYWQ
jgi:hypothetical protein